MSERNSQYDDQVLLELLQKALKKWKWAENNHHQQNDNCMKEEQHTCRAEVLRDTYISLLLEARKRGLTLTKDQLLNCILFPSPDDEDVMQS